MNHHCKVNFCGFPKKATNTPSNSPTRLQVATRQPANDPGSISLKTCLEYLLTSNHETNRELFEDHQHV